MRNQNEERNMFSPSSIQESSSSSSQRRTLKVHDDRIYREKLRRRVAKADTAEAPVAVGRGSSRVMRRRLQILLWRCDDRNVSVGIPRTLYYKGRAFLIRDIGIKLIKCESSQKSSREHEIKQADRQSEESDASSQLSVEAAPSRPSRKLRGTASRIRNKVFERFK